MILGHKYYYFPRINRPRPLNLERCPPFPNFPLLHQRAVKKREIDIFFQKQHENFLKGPFGYSWNKFGLFFLSLFCPVFCALVCLVYCYYSFFFLLLYKIYVFCALSLSGLLHLKAFSVTDVLKNRYDLCRHEGLFTFIIQFPLLSLLRLRNLTETLHSLPVKISRIPPRPP